MNKDVISIMWQVTQEVWMKSIEMTMSVVTGVVDDEHVNDESNWIEISATAVSLGKLKTNSCRKCVYCKTEMKINIK